MRNEHKKGIQEGMISFWRDGRVRPEINDDSGKNRFVKIERNYKIRLHFMQIRGGIRGDDHKKIPNDNEYG